MTFRDQDFGARFARMGDEAEGKFEEIAPLGPSSRFGWNRQANHRFMSDNISYKPDYYAHTGLLVEVMGCSGDYLRALKTEKWEAMKWWNSSGNDVCFFLWNRRRQRWALLDWSAAKKLVARSRRTHGVQAFENDGNTYYLIDWEWIEGEAFDAGDG